MNSGSTWTIWRFVDGKAGHENQTAGLVNALSERIGIRSVDVKPLGFFRAMVSLISGNYISGNKLPRPQIIIGAGHKTHWSMLAAKRCLGARAIVLMKPSLPMQCFDLCIIPEHDHVADGKNILQTRGVLNRLRSGKEKESGLGLILVGGPSRHYEWNSDAVMRQLSTITGKNNHRWVIVGSRRTPDELSADMSAQDNAEWVPVGQTDKDWLPALLGRAQTVWITEDSVSMIYEALTAGASCGLIEVNRRQQNRLALGVDRLTEEGMLVSFSKWQKGQALHTPEHALNEAARCADWIVQNWVNN